VSQKRDSSPTAERNERIRQMAKPNGTWSYRELALEFGISKTRVGQIVNRERRLPKRLRVSASEHASVDAG
jgi:hypothetical protein